MKIKKKKIVTYAKKIESGHVLCLDGWVANIATTGDFYNLGGMNYPRATNGIPSRWTEHTSL
jgi:hypothetical protein